MKRDNFCIISMKRLFSQNSSQKNRLRPKYLLAEKIFSRHLFKLFYHM